MIAYKIDENIYAASLCGIKARQNFINTLFITTAHNEYAIKIKVADDQSNRQNSCDNNSCRHRVDNQVDSQVHLEIISYDVGRAIILLRSLEPNKLKHIKILELDYSSMPVEYYKADEYLVYEGESIVDGKLRYIEGERYNTFPIQIKYQLDGKTTMHDIRCNVCPQITSMLDMPPHVYSDLFDDYDCPNIMTRSQFYGNMEMEVIRHQKVVNHHLCKHSDQIMYQRYVLGVNVGHVCGDQYIDSPFYLHDRFYHNPQGYYSCIDGKPNTSTLYYLSNIDPNAKSIDGLTILGNMIEFDNELTPVELYCSDIPIIFVDEKHLFADRFVRRSDPGEQTMTQYDTITSQAKKMGIKGLIYDGDMFATVKHRNKSLKLLYGRCIE